MNCEGFQAVAGDLARPGNREGSAGVLVIEANDRAGALAHIEDCERCAQTLSDQNDLSEWLRGLADQMNSLQVPAHLEAQLLAAHRKRAGVRSIRSITPRWRYWVSAAAAILLVVLGLMVWRWQSASVRPSPAQANSNSVIARPSQKPQQPLLVPVTGVQTSPQSSGSALPPTQASKGVKRRTLRSDRRFASSQLAKRREAERAIAEPTLDLAANAEPEEVATDFISVGYGSAMDLQDGGQLVRVELPRLALARFGFPMNMDRVDERVKADVLVGADGLARAIRFVK